MFRRAIICTIIVVRTFILNNVFLTAASVLLAFSVSNCDTSMPKESKHSLKSMYKRFEVREKLQCLNSPSCNTIKKTQRFYLLNDFKPLERSLLALCVDITL